MAEQCTLTTPETSPTNTYWSVASLSLDWPNARVDIRLKGTNGESKHHSYNGTIATTLMVALNKANLSITSLHARILQRLVTDGVIAGTISGVVD